MSCIAFMKQMQVLNLDAGFNVYFQPVCRLMSDFEGRRPHHRLNAELPLTPVTQRATVSGISHLLLSFFCVKKVEQTLKGRASVSLFHKGWLLECESPLGAQGWRLSHTAVTVCGMWEDKEWRGQWATGVYMYTYILIHRHTHTYIIYDILPWCHTNSVTLWPTLT